MSRRVSMILPMVLCLAVWGGAFFDGAPGPRAGDSTASFIIQGHELAAARAAVESAGAEITHELGIIDAVAARLTPTQREELSAVEGIFRIYEDAKLRTAGNSTPDTRYPTLIGADRLHAEGLDGAGVTVAVVDTGYLVDDALDRNAAGQPRVLAQYDAISDRLDPIGTSTDTYGHGTHITSMILSSALTAAGKYNGVAPGADLVSVKAFSGGTAPYSDVIRGIDWVVAHQATYGIGVMNLSFAATPRSFYWDDPINQAVMEAWQAGIVVVASAGNFGPGPMTIGVPGNLPYVITAGAMSDGVGAGDDSDDDDDDGRGELLPSFSSAGPTIEGFIKPELVAPGGSVWGLMPPDSTIAHTYPEYKRALNYFIMSGTSQSSAVVAGVAALVLDADPSLSPDDVKCRLLDAARPALDDRGDLAYSIFQQGVGMAHAYDAVYSTATGCANVGLDLGGDLAGTAHFGGPANRDPSGEFFHSSQPGFEWDGSFFAGGFPFVDGSGFPFVDGSGFPFVDGSGFPFVDGSAVVTGYDWLGEYAWAGTPYVWTSHLGETMSVNQWVPQE